MKPLLLAALAGCSSPSTTPRAIPQATTTCSDLACIAANEGKVIDLAGTFAFPEDPKRKGKHLYRLALGDGTSVVLQPDDALRPKLAPDRDGSRMTARCITYTTDIPDRYGIIERTADPYCVELFEISDGTAR